MKSASRPLGQDARNHAQLNNLESKMITDIAANRITDKLKAKRAPHMLLDTVNPAMAKFNIGLENNGKEEVEKFLQFNQLA